MKSLGRLLGSVLALTSAAVLFWPSAAMAVPPDLCDPIMPLDDVSAGMVGQGWTVAQGTDPEAFDVEVLGIAPGLVGPGRDIIIAEISGPLVDAAGGVWAGMSGSPIYMDSDDPDPDLDQLIGALAYGFSLGPSSIVGLTPAEHMERILGYSSGTFRTTAFPARVELPRSVVRMIARETATVLPAMSGDLVRLKLPVSVSGVQPERMRRVKRMLRREHVAAIPYAGSATSLAQVSSIDEFRPGDNFAGALSYGDVTLAGVGTATYVCDGQALAFGHPFLFAGRTTLGASGADAITIVTDPTLTPFKLANIEGIAGTIDQDRLAGIRAVDGLPDTIPVSTAVTSLDTLNARSGQTDVVLKREYPFLAFTHLFSNIDVVFDAIGAGTNGMTFEINGTRADGTTTWSVRRENVHTSDFDISIDSSFELLMYLDTIANNPFERVQFTSVEAAATLEETVREYTLTRLQVCRGGVCRDRDQISAFPGQTINLLATLTPNDGSELELADLSLTIPAGMRFGGEIEITGGTGDCFECVSTKEPESFDALLRQLRRAPTNDTLTATLRSFSGRVRDKDSVDFDRVVRGSAFVLVDLGGLAVGR